MINQKTPGANLVRQNNGIPTIPRVLVSCNFTLSLYFLLGILLKNLCKKKYFASTFCTFIISPFRNKRPMLDEMLQQNTIPKSESLMMIAWKWLSEILLVKFNWQTK